ncbi:MAG: GNAT family N-acetyltransferase [Fusobacteriaceae bacterium]|jgi:ribosomal-protein-alanine N-acetyltransferase|nr:GNAT family N-acetyltransferase [Fusobacteriaceae bacterium]
MEKMRLGFLDRREGIRDIFLLEKQIFGSNYLSLSDLFYMYDHESYELLAAIEQCGAEERIISYLILLDAFETYEIIKFGTVEGERRKGWGKKLLDLAKSMARDGIFLEVRETNRNAIAFYGKNGFEKINIRKNYYRDTNENAVVMCWKNKREEETDGSGAL